MKLTKEQFEVLKAIAREDDEVYALTTPNLRTCRQLVRKGLATEASNRKFKLTDAGWAEAEK